MTAVLKQKNRYVTFDKEAFSFYLSAEIYKRGLKKTEAARQAGVSTSAFIAITIGGCSPSLESYIAICHWMGSSLYKFIGTPTVQLPEMEDCQIIT